MAGATLRPMRAEDEPFLRLLYASTRADEMALLVGWDGAQKRAFLDLQFEAQHRFYQEKFASARFDVVQLGDCPIGRLYVDRREDEIRILDIALLPEHCNAGIGTAFIKELLAEAAESGKPVRIHLEILSPARRLFERLGFRQIEDHGTGVLVEWRPGDRIR